MLTLSGRFDSFLILHLFTERNPYRNINVYLGYTAGFTRRVEGINAKGKTMHNEDMLESMNLVYQYLPIEKLAKLNPKKHWI